MCVASQKVNLVKFNIFTCPVVFIPSYDTYVCMYVRSTVLAKNVYVCVYLRLCCGGGQASHAVVYGHALVCGKTKSQTQTTFVAV